MLADDAQCRLSVRSESEEKKPLQVHTLFIHNMQMTVRNMNLDLHLLTVQCSAVLTESDSAVQCSVGWYMTVHGSAMQCGFVLLC